MATIQRRAGLLLVIATLSIAVSAQVSKEDGSTAAEPQASPVPTATPAVSTTIPPRARKFSFVKDIADDQKTIWLAPFRLSGRDVKWGVPLALVTTGLIFTDKTTSSWVSNNGSLAKISHKVSLGGATYSTVGVAGAFYVIGKWRNDDHAVKTGKLALEALIDTSLVTEAMKFAADRARPNFDKRGRFFWDGTSFPSGHASGSWAVATVIAHEYKNRPLIKYAAYAAAAAISMSRYSGRNHFLSDILIGSSIGFGVGRMVYINHP